MNITLDITDNTSYSFTNDQKRAIDGLIDYIAKPFNPAEYIAGLTGAAGTGKTFITKYIIDHCKYSNSVIKCTSSTHKATRVFSSALNGKNVDTIQATLGLRLNLNLEDFDPDHPQFDPMSTPKLDNVKVLIIDEASMIPAKLVTFINKECKSREIKIIYIGDEYQLAPVKGKNDSPNIKSESIAFKVCHKLYRLREVVRQAKNNPISNLLELLRYDIENKSYTFINYISKHPHVTNYNDIGEGFSICDKKEFINVINNSFSNEEYTRNIDMYRIIAYTNSRVTAWNNYVRNNIIRDADKGIITKNDLIMSYDTITDDFNDIIICNSEEYIINDIVDYSDSKYGLKGFMVKFQLIHGGFITRPLFIIDHTDNYSLAKYIQIIKELKNAALNSTGGTRVKRWKEYYAFAESYLLATNIVDSVDQNKILYKRNIDYGFALTAHKSQGSTYDNVFVDVKNMIYDKNGKPYNDTDDLLRRLYVGCSRARKELILWY